MKKPLFYIVIFVLLFFVIDNAVGYFFDKTRDFLIENGNKEPVTKYLVDKVESNILIVGNSRARNHYVSSALQETFDKSVYNCGVPGQSFEFSTAIIHSVLDRYVPDLFILDLSPHKFEEAATDFNLKELYIYYNKNSYIRELLDHEDPMNKYKMFSKMYRNNSEFLTLVNPIIGNIMKLDNGYGALKVKNNLIHIKETEYETNGKVNRYKIELLEQLIRKIKESNSNLVVVVSPSYYETNYKNLISYKEIKSTLNKHKVLFIDAGDNSLINNGALFKDNAHLNHDGAIEFTKYIADVIKNSKQDN